MATTFPFSIDPSGTWSPRQADAVLRVINPEAEKVGLRFERIDVSTHEKPDRVILEAFCIKHRTVVRPDTACARCLAASKFVPFDRAGAVIREAAEKYVLYKPHGSNHNER